ncbi:ribosomal protein S5 domain 2-like protein [Wallemia mellicola]|nr:ribosomal protein S5 domain 2-like protein [Wallemia mellicola]
MLRRVFVGASRQPLSRCISSTSVLKQQTSYVPRNAPVAPLKPQPKPTNSYYYTGRPLFESSIANLENLKRDSQRSISLALALPTKKLHLLRSQNDTGIIFKWLSQEAVEKKLETHLKVSEYRRLVDLLNSITKLLPAARSGGSQTAQIVNDIEVAVREFEPPGGREIQVGQRKPIEIDELGRSYTVGRRKESSARVWLVPTSPEKEVRNTEILVNNLPIYEFFPRLHDRESITLPFRVTGQLGNFNVFGLVRGGGTSGQAAALAHGIAKGLLGQIDQRLGLESDDERSVKRALKKAGVLLRDPRQVERKKTNLVKARKQRTWVKR